MPTDKQKAQIALGELMALIDNQLLNAAVLATTIRAAKAAGHKEEISAVVFDGDELAAQNHLNLLKRFEELMHSGKTLDQSLAQLRKEKWPAKILTAHLQHLEK